MNDLPYSYHTFLFPFLWNDNGDKKWDDFKKVLSIGNRWVPTSWEKDEIPDGKKTDEWLQDYAAFQYFTEPANAAIFNSRGDNVVRCFEYRHDGCSVKKNAGKYIITKDITKGSETFQLDMNNIRLKVYNSGVAILILELENNQHASLEAVNQINEYGRRINMPFLVFNNTHPVCADRIEIQFDGKSFAVEDFKQTLVGLDENFEENKIKISLDYIMQPLQKLIEGSGSDNEGFEVTTKKSWKNDKKLFIKPCIDDRMFVCCLVVDKTLSDNIKGIGSIEYSFLDGWDQRLIKNVANNIVDHDGTIYYEYKEGWADETYLSNRLYKLIFIETEVTCQNTRMKKDLLCKSIYSRWLDTGILYGSSHHSLICVAHGDVKESVIIPFLTHYIQLAILALAQRATILALSGMASSVAEGFQEDDGIKYSEPIKPEQIRKIERLQAKYVKAQSQLFLTEATVQEQGVEIYQLIKDQLYISSNKAELGEQMNNLRDVANISNERLERKSDDKLNQNLSWLTLIALVFGIGQTILGFLDPTPFFYRTIIGSAAMLLSFISGFFLLRSTLFKSKKK